MTIHGSWTLDALVEAYKQHLRRTRGLREPTLYAYGRRVHPFLREALGDDPINPALLRPRDVIAFITSITVRLSPSSLKAVRTALLSLFRFLRVEGLCDARLEAALPAVAHWRLSTLPRHLDDEQLMQVLASLDTTTPCGHRNRAIVTCLASLGLRPGEIAGLRLDDVDWRGGTIQIRTRKNRRGAVLPLARDAGEAIVDYLCSERPMTTERRVFVQHLGHRRGEPIRSATVSAVVVGALRRAGVEAPLAGAYLFRHTVASRMVRRGVSIKEVADFLGHRSLDTAMIYAKLDLPSLRDVALPWPEVAR
jgi:site-specific recombinase XerD